jgi:hypothetical protein
MQCSSTGDLYEFDRETKPSWKKHIWSEKTTPNVSLSSSVGCALHGLLGSNSVSLFLVTKVCKNLYFHKKFNEFKLIWQQFIFHGVPVAYYLLQI